MLLESSSFMNNQRNFGKSNKRTKYIEYHRFNTEDIKEGIYGSKNSQYNRKTMVWYVIGHWRYYKNTGKKIFINPYWKGPMREIKNNNINTRKRDIELNREAELYA